MFTLSGSLLWCLISVIRETAYFSEKLNLKRTSFSKPGLLYSGRLVVVWPGSAAAVTWLRPRSEQASLGPGPETPSASTDRLSTSTRTMEKCPVCLANRCYRVYCHCPIEKSLVFWPHLVMGSGCPSFYLEVSMCQWKLWAVISNVEVWKSLWWNLLDRKFGLSLWQFFSKLVFLHQQEASSF